MSFNTWAKVDKKASQEAIKSAYRRLVMLYHPDKNKLLEAEEMFKGIAEAYAVLSDPGKRKQYDIDNEPRNVLLREKQERIKYKEREKEAMNIMYV